MDEDDWGYEDYEPSPYNGDDLDGGAHDEYYGPTDEFFYADEWELESHYDAEPWEDDCYEMEGL